MENKIIIVSGLPGSGKSYFARALAQRLGASYINSDIIRNEEGARGKYSISDKVRIYKIMAERASENISAGKSVVVDGTFYMNAMVRLFMTLSTTLSIPIHFILVVADEDLVRQRLSRPRQDSEADFNVYLKIKERLEPLQIPHLTIQSGEDNIDQMLATAIDYLQKMK